jgi:hypothetical protein
MGREVCSWEQYKRDEGEVLGSERVGEGACLDGAGDWLCVRGRNTGALGLKLGRGCNGTILLYVSNEISVHYFSSLTSRSLIDRKDQAFL